MSGLRPAALRALPLGQLRPAGWLARQLQTQADGMAGHLDEIWPDVGDSAWIGGSADGWERGPYWLDGVTPLAFLFDDVTLRAKVDRWVAAILDRQTDDGWLSQCGDGQAGTDADPRAAGDAWPRMVVLKALLQYHAATGDERIVKAALRFARSLPPRLDRTPLHDWGRSRWADLVLSLHRLYDLTGESFLLDLAKTVHRQGYDWTAFAESLPYRDKVPQATLDDFRRRAGGVWMNDDMMATHGVNVAMGMKAPAVWSRQSEDPAPPELLGSLLAQLDQHHGQASGLFSADEHLAGRHPSQGTETCAVVEQMFSLETAVEVWGAAEALVDRLERLAYNALPACATVDDRGHQYVQQANQVVSHVTQDRIYTNNGPDANVFGLEPHFGCCTANRHQGWPKFAARLWMATPDDGLLALSYAPCVLETSVHETPVRVEVRGSYPFDDTVTVVVRVEQPGAFPLSLRVPGWAVDPRLSVGDAPPVALDPGSVHRMHREWVGEQVLTLRLPARMRAEQRPNNAVTMWRGPLAFALAVGESWQRKGGHESYPDWEVHPTTPWNYAVELDPADPEKSLTVRRQAGVGPPFSPEGVRLAVHATGRRLANWRVEHGAAGSPPPSPVDTKSGAEQVVLVPYGAARLRVTELPWIPPR
ncbi:beta-L-arabinofuranosidase domain-containing protein [Actinopolymorpha sp. B9G3]|uniref:beta-L-arabinofuranosidase domain-containing protein n=1 Tax=Actinopolymorpha sp. B9G3 TaxID=3158970 RepID=UPI0032D96989